MKVLFAFVLGALLAPAVVQARSSSSEVTANASRQCSALRVEIGPSIFGATFSSFATCVSKLTPLEEQNAAAAGILCRLRYPVASSPSKPFDSCLVTFAKSASLAEQQSLNPAQRCAALRSSMGTGVFNSKYATSGETADAFGKCVSVIAGVQLAAEASASSTCRVEQKAADFASAHGGKTFAQFYGTSAGGANAFGRCVSLKAQTQVTSEVGQTSTSTQGPSSPQPSSSTTTSTTPSSIDNCSGGSLLGKPNRLMPSDCLPAAPAAGPR
jgi:hypothetical protein